MLKLSVLILLCLVTLGDSKGVNKWCTHNNKFVYTYSSGTHAYRDLNTAKTQCLQKSDCFGITREGGWRYTLRKDWRLRDSPSGEVTYVPCGGYFKCSQFGLVNKWGKFLSAQPDGTVDWDRSHYGSYEVIRFVQNGKDTGSLKSKWNKYLSASTRHHLVWDRSAAYSLERFKVHQYEDKVAFQSYHGRYLSAQRDGTVDVDRTKAYSWEWFTVHPQACLNNIECDCSKTINRDDYEFKSVTYDTTGGHVKAFAPDRVGYQHIDNRDGSVTQSSTFTVSESVQETATFTHTAGASVTLGTEFSVGIPFVGEGKVTASITASYSFSAGNSRSETKTKTATFNCVASAGKSVTCEALLFKYRATIPYTQTWQHKRLPCTCTSTGQFSEISADEMRMTITEE